MNTGRARPTATPTTSRAMAIRHACGRDAAVGSNPGAVGGKAVECAGNHVGKSCNHQDTEQPAEQQEKLLADLADVFLNDIADGTSLVLHRGVHSGKVLHSAEEYAADQDPQQHRHPAENRRLHRTVDGASAGNGSKLVSEDHMGIGRFIVNAIPQFVGRRLGFGINTPLFRQPAAVNEIAGAQYNDGNDHHE